MNYDEFVRDLDAEVGTILSSEFQISVAKTDAVPSSADPAITFPNVDEKRQSTKLLTSCVLYIDIRRSTELSLGHRPPTVAKLYSAFVRAMTRCARRHNGHVRGIIGDRVMVVFDRADAYKNAVHCAIAMNSAATYVVNKHFKATDVTCGIGIDAGNMLVTKTGVRRHGAEQASYRSLVWLGRPANVASKLTDLANKPADTYQGMCIDVAVAPLGAVAALQFESNTSWRWHRLKPWDFVSNLAFEATTGRIHFTHPGYRHASVTTETVTLRSATPAILMTRAVWEGFRNACPDDNATKNGLFAKVPGIEVAGYSDVVYGGNVIFPAYKTAGR